MNSEDRYFPTILAEVINFSFFKISKTDIPTIFIQILKPLRNCKRLRIGKVEVFRGWGKIEVFICQINRQKEKEVTRKI